MSRRRIKFLDPSCDEDVVDMVIHQCCDLRWFASNRNIAEQSRPLAVVVARLKTEIDDDYVVCVVRSVSSREDRCLLFFGAENCVDSLATYDVQKYTFFKGSIQS